MTFGLYLAPIGGAASWSETQTVEVDQGHYSLILGSASGGIDLPFDVEYFLGIAIGAGIEMTPRQPLTAVPYALNAVSASVASYATNVANGAISGSTIQDGSVTDADIGGIISGSKIGDHTHPAGDITGEVDADLLDGQDSTNFANTIQASANVDAIQALEQSVIALQAQVAELQDRLQHVSRNGNDLYVAGANLHILSGAGFTDSLPNGLGNLVVGYNERRNDGSDVRAGSHNVVIGTEQNYQSYGGLVAGRHNSVSGGYSTVAGGRGNVASGNQASISGGINHTASADDGWVGGDGVSVLSEISLTCGFNQTLVDLAGNGTWACTDLNQINSLSQLDGLQACSPGDVIRWNGTNWVCAQ